MRRLFSTFASGAPGLGLVLLRFACATLLLIQGITGLQETPLVPAVLLRSVSIGLAILLIAGLWTPIAASLAALEALVIGISNPAFARYWFVAVVCAALALLGPGAWSVDAKLFGWKRIAIDIDER